MKSRSTHLLAMVLSGVVYGAPARAVAPPTGELVDCVNPLSGANGDSEFSRGNTLAAIVAPFGMTTWAPQTDGNASPFYQVKHQQFEGLRATHQPSIWVRDYGDFLLMPVTGPVSGSDRDRASRFSHHRETARPYYYAVHLDRYRTGLELTPTERCALLRLTFPDAPDAALVFSGEMEFSATGDPQQRQLRGKATHVTFGAPRDFGMYFVAELSHPFQSVELQRNDNKATAIVRLEPLAASTSVLMRIGTSFISYEQAELNLRNELPDWDFDQAMSKAKGSWARALARVEIQGATAEQAATFYTALYRVLQFPRMFHEPDAAGKVRHYSPFADGKVFDGPLYTDNGLWDTYRAAFPLLLLYYPERASDILEGWLNAYREGGRLPNWPSPGNRPCMIGSHSDSILADAWVKGRRTFDLQDAYSAVRKNATENDAWGWAGRDHLDEYIAQGYVPADVRPDAAAACTLEYAYDDYCVSRLAKAAGREDDFAMFVERAKNYRHVWDAQTGFMRGRLASGAWQAPFDPLAWGGAFIEGNAWQWLWSVQHDPYGLMELLGGRAKTARKLDELLSLPTTTVVGSYARVIHEMREVEYARMGQYAHVNEPDHHVLYFYNYAGQPWKTQFAVRRVLRELYDEHGMIGDEDTGQMSAWYVFNAAGLYPFCPGSPYYLIGSPLFEETTIHLAGGKTFAVRATNNSSQNCYIQAAKLNGQRYTKSWMHHDAVVAGGLLELEMGARPNELWGSADGDAPPNDFP